MPADVDNVLIDFDCVPVNVDDMQADHDDVPANIDLIGS